MYNDACVKDAAYPSAHAGRAGIDFYHNSMIVVKCNEPYFTARRRYSHNNHILGRQGKKEKRRCDYLTHTQHNISHIPYMLGAELYPQQYRTVLRITVVNQPSLHTTANYLLLHL